MGFPLCRDDGRQCPWLTPVTDTCPGELQAVVVLAACQKPEGADGRMRLGHEVTVGGPGFLARTRWARFELRSIDHLRFDQSS